MEKHIQLPLTEELAKTLHAGDTVYLSGTIYTSRDAGHKRMCEALARGEKIPFDLENFFNNASAKAEQKQSEYPESLSNVIVIGSGTEKKSSGDTKSEIETVGYEDLTIYLDGKVISGAEMQEIKPDKIASIEVDKKGNIIRITSK